MFVYEFFFSGEIRQVVKRTRGLVVCEWMIGCETMLEGNIKKKGNLKKK